MSDLRVCYGKALYSSNDSRKRIYSPGSNPVPSIVTSVEVERLLRVTNGSSEPDFCRRLIFCGVGKVIKDWICSMVRDS